MTSTNIVIVGALFLLTAVAFMRTPLLPDMGEELQLSATQIGLIMTFFGLGRVVTNFPAGWLADRVSSSVLSLSSAALMAVGTYAVAFGQLLSVILVGVTVVGIASASMSTVAMTSLTREAPPNRRGQAMAIYSTSLMAGQMLGPALAGFAAAAFTWRVTHSVAASLAVVVLLTIAAIAWRSARRSATAVAAGGAAKPVEQPDLLTPWSMAAVCLIAFTVFFTMGGLLFTVAALIADEELGMSTVVIGLGLGLAGFARIVGANISGKIADSVSRRAAILPSLIVLAVSPLMFIPLNTVTWFIGVTIFAFATSGVAIASTVIADRSPKRVLGRRMGLYRALGDLGLFMGPVTIAAVYEHTDRLWTMVVLAAVTVIVMALTTKALGNRTSIN
ncbi:MFS transporter [Nesterenkonia ebinurensis]|uniref:MFS transporter n=1 Tax=Nesterenkonia ebinurensis TaxID=2608252 RepID=UPI00123DA549|nr:MFS transporter [Nesterenkonia ebinurensis]